MNDEKQALERVLLADPFATLARERYAELLFHEGAHAASLTQYRSLLKQQPRAHYHLSAALCCRHLSDADGAREHLTKARSEADFDASDPRIVELEAFAPAPRLQLLTGDRREVAEVVSIGRSETIRFADVVGMTELKKVLRLRIVEPFANPSLFQRFKKKSGGGVLLYGPPGCGKTMIARAIAGECNASFTPVGISEILGIWVGQSERNLAAVFEHARARAPSVLFFDELDALAFSRSKAHSDHTRTLVNEFLSQLDGFAARNERVLVLAATNMPWDVDDAMKRPGRFDRQIFVPPPDAEARSEMFRAKLRDVPHRDVDYASLGARSEHFSGADIDGVIELAKDEVLSSILDSGAERPIAAPDLVAAMNERTPSTLEWLKTARTLVKYGGAGAAYKEVEAYLKRAKLY